MPREKRLDAGAARGQAAAIGKGVELVCGMRTGGCVTQLGSVAATLLAGSCQVPSTDQLLNFPDKSEMQILK